MVSTYAAHLRTRLVAHSGLGTSILAYRPLVLSCTMPDFQNPSPADINLPIVQPRVRTMSSVAKYSGRSVGEAALVNVMRGG